MGKRNRKGRSWSPEQRAAASERAKAQGFGAQPKSENGVAALTEEQILIAEEATRGTVSTKEALADLVGPEEKELVGEGSTVTHKVHGRVAVWKLTPQGWQRREIPGTAVSQALASGMKARCQDCGGTCGDGVNDCPGREPVAFRSCPVCGRPIYDLDIMPPNDDGEPADAEIRDDSFITTTPAIRTKAKLEAHMLAYHQAEAAAYGIVRPGPGVLAERKAEAVV